MDTLESFLPNEDVSMSVTVAFLEKYCPGIGEVLEIIGMLRLKVVGY